MTDHHPKCLCYTCERLPANIARIRSLTLREMTANGTMTGLQRHWMEQFREEQQCTETQLSAKANGGK